ncbi:MAG: TIGR03545 family protein [Treponema sp.]|nr:TIGR03545 family protein [Treponema sp.]
MSEKEINETKETKKISESEKCEKTEGKIEGKISEEKYEKQSENVIAETDAKDAKKKIPAKKLPGLFRKKYTKEKFEKKILKKIYIESDSKLVESIFTETSTIKGKDYLFVNLEKELGKADFAQLKEIAKAINANKFRMKLVPLFAVIAFVAALVIVVTTFKNPIAKKIIKSSCESIFEAKTDIRAVDVQLLGISIRVSGIAIGDKDSKEYGYKKNLFEAEKITVDMNFTQALRGKAIINDISAEGMKFGTDRTTSCYIPPKEKKSATESKFEKELKSRSNKAIEDLKAQAAEIAGGSSVDEIVSNIESQLKTPAAAKKAQEDVQNLVAKWQAKPEELKTQVETFSESVKDLQNLDVKSIKAASDIEKVKIAKEYIEKINSSIKQGDELKKSFEKTASEVKADVKSTDELARTVAEAVKSDKDLAVSLVEHVTDTVKNSGQILNTAFNTVGYDMLGKYYPYVQKGIAYAVQMKKESDASSATKEKTEKKPEKKESVSRMKGTTIYHSRQYPGLWIKNVSASGYTENDGSKGFSGAIKNITSNQNMIGSPTTAEAKFDVGETNHKGKLTLDVRKSSSADLISVSYKGSGFSAKVDGTKISSASGIPSIDGKATLTLEGSAGGDGFSANGKVEMNPVTLTSDGFSNELVTKYYTTALETIKDISVGYKMSYRDASGLSMDISGNFMERFAEAFRAAFMSALGDAKEAAIAKVNEKINSASGEVTEKIKSFAGIEGEIDIQNVNLDTVRNSLEAKKAELENIAKGKVDEAKEKANEKAQEATNKAKDKATEKTKEATSNATNALKGKLLKNKK